MKAQGYIISGAILVLAVLALLYGTGTLSVIGQGITTAEKCRLNESTLECTIPMTLPEYRELSSYTLDLVFFKVPGDYVQETTASYAGYVGPLIEEDDKDLPSAEEELQTNYVYIYDIPWSDENIYSIAMDVKTDGWVKNTNLDASVELDVQAGYITIPHSQDSVKLCGDSCDTSMNVVRHYVRDSTNEWKFYLYNTANVVRRASDGKDLDTDDSDYDALFGQVMSGTLHEKGSFVLDEALDRYDLTRDEFKMYVYLEADERLKGYTDWNLAVPPQVTLSYAKSLQPTNIDVYVGNEFVETITGSPDNATTMNLASAINNYCERNSETDECEVPITFKSDEGGVIVISNENADLRAQEGGVDDGENFITGAITFAGDSFDFNEHPLQAFITVVVLVTLAMTGLLIYQRRKRK